jgi:PAS domain S-box-containing protein
VRPGSRLSLLNLTGELADIETVTNSIGLSSSADGFVATSSVRPLWRVLVPVLSLAASVCVLAPLAGTRLGGQPAFIPVMLALICCFDVFSIALLVGQFRHSGELRALSLSWAYVFSLVSMLGWAAAFPGVFGSTAPLGAVPSTSPWLWVVWHTGFPVLLGVSLGPWRRAWERSVPAGRRRVLTWTSLAGAAVASASMVATVLVFADFLPVIIQGTDTRAMTRLAGPFMLPVVFLATVVTVAGACRRAGPERWAGLAAAASLGDVVLTLFSSYRFSLGWYAGRTLTIVSAAVVLVALLGEFNRMRRWLALESDRLSAALECSGRLERVQHTLLGHMADGVVMHGRGGELVASNPAALRLLRLTVDQLSGRAPADPGWQALSPDGTPLDAGDNPTDATFRTAAGQRDAIVGVRTAAAPVRWVSINTAAVEDSSGTVEYVVSSMNDVTERHAAGLAAEVERRDRRNRIQQVLDAGGPRIVFQPIIELATGKPVGAEALARFPVPLNRATDEWFADAADVGLGVPLELAAIRAAVSQLDELPAGAYLSVNAGPDTVVSPEFQELLRSVPPCRLVVELTEHVAVTDYPALTDALDALRSRGVRLAVDDAGSGFSSLQHILNLKPDIIKLDRSLVDGIDSDPARRALAGSLLTFANEIGAQVIAEGIENLREQTVLRRLGVRYGQGFHLGRPRPLPLAGECPRQGPRLVAVNGG